MFDIGWSELLVIAVVAVVVIGPKDLPKALRAVGQWTAKMKRMAREFQGQFNEALREAELDGIKRDVEALATAPLGNIQDDLDKTGAEIRQGLADAVKPPEPVIAAPTSEPSAAIEPPAAPASNATTPASEEAKS